MAIYINSTKGGTELPHLGKAAVLIQDGAKQISAPLEWREGIVCVVNNGPFEAAAYIDSPSELEAFSMSHDYRPKVWLEYYL